MVKGWKSMVVPDEVFNRVKNYFEENREELKLKSGVRSLTGFMTYCIREYLKERGAISSP
jgi:hypothetical protein